MRERAEPDCSAPAGAVLAEAVLQRAWLPPSAASLTVLARHPLPSTWTLLRNDPGAVLLLVRGSGDGRRSSFLARMFDPNVLDEAIRLLDLPGEDAVDWASPVVQPVYRTAVVLATLAREHAVRGGDCDPDEAWACGLLAPLGWLGVCAADPIAAASCLADPLFARNPSQTQRRHWGLDQFSLARRLARRWRLPQWLTVAVGCLNLPPELAAAFAPDPALLRGVRGSVEQAREQGADLGLGKAADSLRESARPTAERLDHFSEAQTLDLPKAWASPYRAPLLRDLLVLAAENRRLQEATHGLRLENEVDHLHEALEQQAGGEEGRLKAGKLDALAEFAAGAGHEINNPLAVISGQAQYVLAHADSWFQGDAEQPRKALQTIIGQTHRVHGILCDVMQFARPAAPRPVWFDLPSLLAETAASLGELADHRRIRIEVGRTPDRLSAFADVEQVRQALTCLLRNAVEAAPADSWARIRVVEPVSDAQVEVAVEDGGPGPDAAQRLALFDPFYSGRAAGRGRGLGLPIAWRLARRQGGDVRLDPTGPDEPTRFLLSLPRPSGAPESPADLAVPERRAS